MIAVGKFLKPFGIKGEIKFLSYSGARSHLSNIKEFYLEQETSIDAQEHVPYVVSTWNLGSVIRCKIQGFNTPESVEYFKNKSMLVALEKAQPLFDDEYYVSDLIDMNIFCKGKKVGVVSNVFTDAYAPLLEIRCDNQKKILLPFIKRFFGKPVKTNDKDFSQLSYSVELLEDTLLDV